MPRRSVHTIAGVCSGATLALYRGRQQPPWDQLVEGVGGAAGGFIGGRLPDLLEPALHGWHRSTAHSWAAGAAVSWATSAFAAWEQHCRSRAAAYAAVRQGHGDVIQQFLALLAELFWRLAAGFVSGAAAGYGSHLVLDSFTSRGLPLIAR